VLKNMRNTVDGLLPLMKGEIERGLGISNLPLTPSFIRRGNPLTRSRPLS